MLEIHKEEHKINQKLKGQRGDTIPIVGNDFCSDLNLFCVDEF
jgi:predicted ATPase